MSNKVYTYFGLIISFFSIATINLVFKTYYGAQLDNATAIVRELLIFCMVGLLFWIIIKKEKLTLASIGLYRQGFMQSILWALIIAVLNGIGIVLIVFVTQQLGWQLGSSHSWDNLSLWTVTLIVLRAGVAEEVFFRGYIIERLSGLTGSTVLAAIVSLIAFALFHYNQGYAGIFAAFILGGIMTAVYIWKRDLKANIIAHFLVDFVLNVLLPLVSG